MHNAFSELCHKIQKYAGLSAKNLHRPECQYENSEIIYLIISQWLKEFRKCQRFHQDIILGPISTSSSHHSKKDCKSNNASKSDVFLSLDDSFFSRRKILQNKSYSRTVGFYNLFTNEIRPFAIASPRRPKIFSGSLEISNKSIQIDKAQSKVSIDVIGQKYRLAKYKVESRIHLDLSDLNAFGVVKYNTDNGLAFEVEYVRHTSGYDDVFCSKNSLFQLESLAEILEFLKISPQKFLNCKIRLYTERRINSEHLMQDLSYYSKNYSLSNIMLDDLIDNLEASIPQISCDLLAYELYLSAIFLKRIYRINSKAGGETIHPSKHLEGDELASSLLEIQIKESSKIFSGAKLLSSLKKMYNRPRQTIKNTEEKPPNALLFWNQILDFPSFVRFSKNIDIVLNLGPKSLLHRLIYIIRYYELGLKFEEEYIKTSIPPNTHVFLESILTYKIYREYNLKTDGVFFNETLEKLSKKFCKELNHKLKNHGEIAKMFDDLVINFCVDGHLRNTLIHDISSIFLSRIHKVGEINGLKELFAAALLFEKKFMIKNLRLEKELKDKALKLIREP